MKKYSTLSFFLLFLAGASSGQSITQQLDSFMQASNHAHTFNGMVLVARNDSILLQKGYGYRDAQKQIPHDSSSLFQIGSLSKSFTAICILQLQEQGRLRLSDKLSRYFPFYKIGSEVTIENLLSHTGGIWEYSKDDAFMNSIYSGHLTQAAFWELVGKKPLDFTPGTEFSYSNTGYMMLGYLIEKVTGRTYWQVVREGIFNKAGMRSSGFDFAGSNPRYRSVGYEVLFTKPQEPARIVDSSYSFAAGAIYSSVGDLYRYSKALLSGKLINAATMNKAFTPVLKNYGYGWTIDSIPGMRVVEHQGGIPGFLTILAMVPENKTTIILLSNSSDPGVALPVTYMDLVKVLMGWSYVLPRLAVDVAPDSLAAYTGDYASVDNKTFIGHFTMWYDHLQVQWNKDDPQELFAEKKDSFFLKLYDAQLVFVRNAAGKVTGFTAHVGKKSFVYQRVGTP